jgi:hypothetical protein
MGKGKYVRTKEHRKKISETLKGYKHSKETREKMSEAKKGERHPNFGKKCSEETARKISTSVKKKMKDPEIRRKISESLKKSGIKPPNRFGIIDSEETRRKKAEARKAFLRVNEHPMKGRKRNMITRRKLSEVFSGENNPNWKGGISFEPYCVKFNNDLKEVIRNRDGRTCRLCEKSELFNGRKLDVHHIDGDKMQGCNNKKWYLASLCMSCNSKADSYMKEFLIVSNLNVWEDL